MTQPHSGRGDLFDADMMVKCIKRQSVSANRFWSTPRGTVTGRNPELAEIVAGEALEFLVRDIQDAVLVPIPGSQTVSAASDDFAAKRLATQMALHLAGATVLPALQWASARPPLHETPGYRTPQALFPNLVLAQAVPAGRPVVLVDDVFTSGAHVKAAAQRLALDTCWVAVAAKATPVAPPAPSGDEGGAFRVPPWDED